MRAVLFALLMGTYTVSVFAAPPSTTDSRKVWWVDPRTTLAANPSFTDLSVGNSVADLRYVPEAGWYDAKISKYLFQRVTDPANGSKRAFRHYLQQGMTLKNGTSARSETAAKWGWAGNLQIGQPYWAVFAFYVGSDHPFNGSGDDLNIWEIGHPVKTASGNTIPTPAFFIRRNGTWDALLSYTTNVDSTAGVSRTTAFSRSLQKGVWNYVVVQFKLHWDKSKGPYFRVWQAVGSGAPAQLVNTSVANYYRESVTYTPSKFGLYSWNPSTGWGSSSSRTLYTKGVHVFKDVSGASTLDVNSLLEYIRAI